MYRTWLLLSLLLFLVVLDHPGATAAASTPPALAAAR